MSEAPSWSDNPFGQDNSGATPFADSSVTEASSTMPEYDPFTNTDATDSYAAAEVQPTENTITPDWASKEDSAPKLTKKQQKAAEKAQKKATQEDERREAEYAKNQASAEEGVKDPFYRPANWPPFPEGCCYPFKPCFHHDFKREIPDWGYSAVKVTYYKWAGYIGCLFWNMICCFAALGLDNPNYSSAGLSVAYFLLMGPLSYCCWFQSLYQAMRKDSSLRFGWFFFTFTFQWLTSVIFSIGIPGWGSSGIWYSIYAVNENAIIGILMFTSAAWWIIMALFNSYIIKIVLGLYRSSGQSLQRAQQEAVSGAAPHIANAAMNNKQAIAKAAIASQA